MELDSEAAGDGALSHGLQRSATLPETIKIPLVISDPFSFSELHRRGLVGLGRDGNGSAAGDGLGNISHIDAIYDALSPRSRKFPTLLNKVIYDGGHCGDPLTVKQVEKLKAELELLKNFRSVNKNLDKEIQALRRQLNKLVSVSLRIQKPIAF